MQISWQRRRKIEKKIKINRKRNAQIEGGWVMGAQRDIAIRHFAPTQIIAIENARDIN